MYHRVAILRLAGCIAALVAVASCGGGGSTPTAPPATPTVLSATPTPTRAADTPTASPATPTPRPTATAVPPTPPGTAAKRGGILQLRALQLPPTWDTYDSRNLGGFGVTGPMLNNLVWIDPYGDKRSVTGDLATRWELSADAKTYTFTVAKGVKFHDGSPFSAKDVAYNLERGWKPRSTTMTGFLVAFKPIESVSAQDDSTVRVTLSNPSAAFLSALTTNAATMYPAHLSFPETEERWKTSPVGTGPFRYKSATLDQIELEKNIQYWKPGLPYLDGIRFFVIPSTDAAIAAEKSGQIHLEAYVGQGALAMYKAEPNNPRSVFYPKVLNNLNGVYVNTNRTLWQDARVRQALSLAIDRQNFVELFSEGLGVLTGPLIPPERGGQWGIPASEIAKRPGYRPDKAADLAQAKQLLADAGVVPGQITVNILEGSLLPIRGEVMERSVASLGFKTKLDLLATAPKLQRERALDFDLEMTSLAPSVDDPISVLAQFVTAAGNSNPTKYSNAKVESLLAEQDKTLDVAKRKQLLVEMQDEIMRDNVYIPVIVKDNPVWHFSFVKNYPDLPLWFSNRHRHEQVWLDR